MSKKLFTPGPLSTSASVKACMLRDVGSRDKEFIETAAYIRRKLTEIADPDTSNQFTSILLQGSGTFAIEAVFANVIGNTKGKVLILSNGAYGDRMSKICEHAKYDFDFLRFPENDYLNLTEIENHLKNTSSNYDLISFVHSETSSGVINPLKELCHLAKSYSNAYLFVDAMSSFGAVPINMATEHIDFLVSSANKCLEGVPGFSYIVCRKLALESTKGRCLSLSFDLYEQWKSLENNGQFRFTPPTHSMLAFKKALHDFEAEGGLKNRGLRYAKNCEIIKEGMKKLGFQLFLDDKRHKGYIITSFYYPSDPNFDFQKFYSVLSDRGYVLYPGKVTIANCFRIGNIGHLFPEDCQNLLLEIERVLTEMNITMEPRSVG